MPPCVPLMPSILNEIKNLYILLSEENDGGDCIYNVAVWICKRLKENQIIPAESEKKYIYGFELLISSVVGIFWLILLSALSEFQYAWLPYLMGFIPLRVTGGGYHAKTHFTCIFMFSAVFLILLYSGKIIVLVQNIHIIIAIASFAVMYFFAPVETKNKPLSRQLRQRNRKRCLVISWCAISFSAALVLMKINNTFYVMMYFMGAFAADVSILAVVIMRKIMHNV